MAQKNVELVLDMCESIMTVVRCTVGMPDGLKVEVGPHQGWGLCPFLFAMVMERLMDVVRPEACE